MKENLKTLIVIIVLISFYRFFVLLNSHIDLYVDEAYYWYWSRHLDFGYYSKPPMIAWIIALFTSICGNSSLCIKLPSLIFYPLTTLFVYLSAKELFNTKIAFWSALAFFTLPAVSMSSLIISTDVFLLFFWSLTLWLFIKALKSDKWLYWIAAGVTAAGGLLSKYTMILFLLSVFIYALWQKRALLKNLKLYTAALLAATLYFPNFWWNMHHHFISFVHTKQISGIEKTLFHPSKMVEFLAAQFLVFGPIFFALFLKLLIKPITKPPYPILYSFSVPFLAIITLQALLSHALANWAAPTYIAATILVVGFLIERNYKKLLYLAITINIFLALLFYHYHNITHALGIELTRHNDPYKRVLGFRNAAKKIEKIVQKYPHTPLLFDDRQTMSEMIYYLKRFDAVMLNPSKKIRNQFDMDTNLSKAQDFIYITKHKNLAKPYFNSSQKIGKVNVPLYKDFNRSYNIYYLHHFKGYR